MTLSELINRFGQLIVEDRHNGKRNNEAELEQIFPVIINEMVRSYAAYRLHYPILLDIFEKNTQQALLYGFVHLDHLYHQLFSTITFYPENIEFLNDTASEELSKQMIDLMGQQWEQKRDIRISQCPFNFDIFSNKEKSQLAASLIGLLEQKSIHLNWTAEEFETINMMFIGLHQLLTEIGEGQVFFQSAAIFLDRFATSENYQQGRDFTEEILITGFNDEEQDLAFLNAFRIYTASKNATAGVINGCMALRLTINKRDQITDRHARDIVTQCMKYYRNVNMFPFAEKIYKNLPQGLTFPDYNRRALDHAYFYTIALQRKQELPSLLLDYLNKERESIFKMGALEAQPWLLMLMQFKRLYPDAYLNALGLGYYLNVFESMIEDPNVQKQMDIIKADSADIITHLKTSIVKLNATNHRTDISYDNQMAGTIANRALEYSFKEKNASGFLLAMLIKADHTILFNETEIHEDVRPFEIAITDLSELNERYDDPTALMAKIPMPNHTCIIWLGVVEGKLYQLNYFNGVFEFHQPVAWDAKAFRDVRNSDYIQSLKFIESKKHNNQVRLLYPEEHHADSKVIAENLAFGRIVIPDGIEEIYFIKDILLAEIPNQLLTDVNGDYFADQIPVTQILSIEWLLRQSQIELSADYSKAAWIPLESLDSTLDWLYGNIENALDEYKFEITKAVELEKPLTSDLNLIGAHGEMNIADFQVLHFGEGKEDNLGRIVGPGKILIFFVCHSGSVQSSLFKNEMTSLVRQFIEKGYQAVIASAWRLDVSVPKYWLPAFLSTLQTGKRLSEAAFAGNKSVYDQIPNAAAWACLHLYGNPNLVV